MPRTLHLLIVAFAIVCLSSVAAAQEFLITGNATYRERIALPPTAILEVTLEDVSRPGTAGTVLERAEVSGAQRSPLPYAIEYDPASIEGGRRYAVQARVIDGDRVLFTTRQAALVLTQGHGVTTDLQLTMVTPPSAQRSAASPRPTVAPLDPATLPATFVGTLPCADCPGIRHELTLFPDDAFVLRRTRLGAKPPSPVDEIGSWVRSSDSRLIMLETSTGTRGVFSVVDGQTLRPSIPDSAPSQAGLRDLRRSARLAPVELSMTMTGVYRVVDGQGQFAECSTGQRWPLSASAEASSLDAALTANKGRVGNGIFATVQGRVTPGTGAALTVVRVVSTDSVKKCAPRFVSLTLEGASWRLTELGAAPIAPQQGRSGVIGLSFREETGSFAGNGGCHRLAGTYRVAGDELTLRSVGTLRACPTVTDTEARFRTALTDTRRYRVLGRSLQLFDTDGRSLATFEAE
jgi:uncharacterized lipoprotein YbaY/heat shock protein HslJ